MPTLQQIEATKAARAINEAQALLKANPKGFNAEQEAQFNRLVQAAEDHHKRAGIFADQADQAQMADQDAALRQDLFGMAVTGEAPAEIAAAQSEAAAFMQGRDAAGNEVNRMTISQTQAARWNDHLREGRTAREWIRQDLTPAVLTAGGNTIPIRIAAEFYDSLYRVNGIRSAGATVMTTEKGEDLTLPKIGDAPLGAATFTRNTSNITDLQTAITDDRGQLPGFP